MARSVFVSGLIVALLFAIGGPSSMVLGAQWLPNGDFENGTANVHILEGSPVTCTPQSGAGAAGVRAVDPEVARLLVKVPGPLPAGSFTLSGWTRRQAGPGSVKVKMTFIDEGGVASPIIEQGIPSGAQYTSFSIPAGSPAFAAESAEIVFEVLTIDIVEFCIDNLQLTTPEPTPTSTATPTETPIPNATATTPATATATEPPATSTPTATPTLTTTPTVTTTATPTSTPTPTPTTPAGPGFVFTNGGFEAGLQGWNKYGGTLQTTASALSGAAAGLLTSTTESTKWAYQAVHVAAGQFYEFSGYVQPDAGVREALLRISWYATSDTSGSALSTTDSTSTVTGAGGSYVFLTTGAVRAPAGAASARVRILLAPQSAAAASLRIDDVAFFAAAAPTATPTPTSTASATPTATPSSTPGVPMLGAASPATPVPEHLHDEATSETSNELVSQALAAPAGGAGTTARTTRLATTATAGSTISEIASARSEARAVATAMEPPAVQVLTTGDPGSDISWPWLLGIALVVGGLAGAVWQNRQAAK